MKSFPENTVVVIGAGASADFGIPINSELKELLIDAQRFLGSKRIREMKNPHFGKPYESIDILLNKLTTELQKNFGDSSLDIKLKQLLSDPANFHKTIDKIWEELHASGEKQLARFLKIKACSSLMLFMLSRRVYSDKSWIFDLSKKIGIKNVLQMKWIIFNYDLFFEEDLVDLYLESNYSIYSNKEQAIRGLTRITNSLALEIESAKPITKTIRPMGWVDPSVYNFEKNFHNIIYNVNNNQEHELNKFVDSILENENFFVFINEPLNVSSLPAFRDRLEMENLVESCEKIIFLGYGFNESNNKMLSNNFEKVVLKKSFGTAYRMGRMQELNNMGAKLLNKNIKAYISNWENNTST